MTLTCSVIVWHTREGHTHTLHTPIKKCNLNIEKGRSPTQNKMVEIKAKLEVPTNANKLTSFKVESI